MQKRIIVFTMAVFSILFIANSCKHKPFPAPEPGIDTVNWGGYPTEIGRIFLTKCATAGCHNQASYTLAGNLLMDTWTHLFDGGGNGAAVVAYNSDYSPLLYFINTAGNGNADPIAAPTMPNNGTPLTKDEYNTIKNWINKGAPDRNGNIPFASNATTRQKLYMTMQGCDKLGVLDAEKKIMMRVISIGNNPGVIESAHSVHTSPDGQYAYVCFSGGSYVQKISTLNDSIVGEINIGAASWNAFNISPDGSKIAISDLNNGLFVTFNANTMSGKKTYSGFTGLHGVAANSSFDTFFVTSQLGNTIYRIAADGDFKKISIDGNTPGTSAGVNTPDPHEAVMVPDYSKYLVSCQKTNEIRVMKADTGTLLKVIPVGKFPQEIVLSKTKPYAFVTCTEDSSYTSSSWKGSVYVINYNTLEIVKRIDGNFYQPHGLGVDDRNGVFYVVSRNFSISGPAPHHSSSCAGRNGFYHVYDLNTLSPVNSRRYEVAVDPYYCEARFKD